MCEENMRGIVFEVLLSLQFCARVVNLIAQTMLSRHTAVCCSLSLPKAMQAYASDKAGGCHPAFALQKAFDEDQDGALISLSYISPGVAR